ncbi:rhodanese-like domain-containing protein [Thiohalorhabdus sp. Cl-TMA]|uniref:Rhodanese-like domain-containing protein n=1 Tax=Thiohalorhabdus methylotrophus TaxID=3242694 RepID=A0ABV4TSI1_9GAMM
MARSHEALLDGTEARVPHLAPGEMPGLEVEGSLVVDVRTLAEYAEDHLPGAVNLPRDTLEARIADHLARPEPPVVGCCDGRGRSTLAEMGMDVRILRGGVAAWRDQKD